MGLRPAPNRNFLSCADREIVNGLDRMATDHGFRPGGIIIILQEGAMRLDSNWLFFNIEGLSSLETAMSMLIANATAERASGRSGQPSIYRARRMLAAAGFADACTRGGPALPHGAEALRQRVGNL